MGGVEVLTPTDLVIYEPEQSLGLGQLASHSLHPREEGDEVGPTLGLVDEGDAPAGTQSAVDRGLDGHRLSGAGHSQTEHVRGRRDVPSHRGAVNPGPHGDTQALARPGGGDHGVGDVEAVVRSVRDRVGP